MTLIYLVSAPDHCRKGSVCVRAEIMTNREDPIVLYRCYKTRSHKRAKLNAMFDIFSRFKFPKTESITVLADDERISWEWKDIWSGDELSAEENKDWAELMPHLLAFDTKPQIKDKGCLTTAMRSDMNIYLMQN